MCGRHLQPSFGSFFLVYISESLIFLVGLNFPVVRLDVFRNLFAILPFIGPDMIQKQNERNDRTGTLGSHEDYLGVPIAWSIFGLECLRPNNVPMEKLPAMMADAMTRLVCPAQLATVP